MIHGYLGVGKTTIAKVLAERTGAIYFSADEWMVEFYGHDPAEEKFGEYFENVQRVLDSIWPEVLAKGIPVVLDFGFWGAEYREGRVRLAWEAGGDVRWVKVVCSDDEAWRRIQERNVNLDKSLYVAENTYHVLRGRFEELDDCEFVIVTEKGDPESLVMSLLRQDSRG